MREIKQEWCEAFIRAAFTKHHAFPGVGGIEVGCLWDMAEKAGLWVRGTYNTPMSWALEKLCTIRRTTDEDGRYLYSAFFLAA